MAPLSWKGCLRQLLLGREVLAALIEAGLVGAEIELGPLTAATAVCGSARRRRISWPTRGLMVAISFVVPTRSITGLFCGSVCDGGRLEHCNFDQRLC